MLAQAKPRIGRGWDLVSLIDCIAKLRIIELQQETRAVSARASYALCMRQKSPGLQQTCLNRATAIIISDYNF
jgi:hypothetical protein